MTQIWCLRPVEDEKGSSGAQRKTFKNRQANTTKSKDPLLDYFTGLLPNGIKVN